MPRNSHRQPPTTDYSNAPKNLRSFRDQSRIIPQGIIDPEHPTQNVHNVEHIIKYLKSNAFRSMIEGMIQGALDKLPPQGEGGGETIINNENPFDPTNILNDIKNIWNWINNYEAPEIPDYAIPGNGKLTFLVNGNPIGEFLANQSTDNPINLELTEGGEGGDNLVANVPFYIFCQNSQDRQININIPENVRFVVFIGNPATNLTNVILNTPLNNRDFYVINRTNLTMSVRSADENGNVASTPYNLSGNSAGVGLRYVFSDGYSTNTLESFNMYGPGRPGWTPSNNAIIPPTGPVQYP